MENIAGSENILLGLGKDLKSVMPRDDRVLAYSQSGRDVLPPSSAQMKKALLSTTWEKGLLI
jgi:hypothetical protein